MKKHVTPTPPPDFEAAHAKLFDAKAAGRSMHLHHLLAPLRYALSDLEMFGEQIALDNIERSPHAMFDRLDDAAKTAVHELYVG